MKRTPEIFQFVESGIWNKIACEIRNPGALESRIQFKKILNPTND